MKHIQKGNSCMKKILILVLCLMLAASAALAETEQAPGSQLGLELLNTLYTQGENTLISPQSLALALGMAAEGAQGETLAQLMEGLGVEDLSEITAQLPEGLKIANSLFVKAGLELDPEVLDHFSEQYGAQQFVLDADVVEKVNQWVEEHTDGLIENMLSEVPKDNIGLLFLNAIAMDAQWSLPFDPAGNTTQAFHTSGDAGVEVEMMHQTEYFRYAEKDGVQLVCLPYADGEMEMWVVLPQQGQMAELLDRLTEENGLAGLCGDAAEREVALSLPKFDVADENTLSDALKTLGMDVAFGADADFSGLSDVPVCLDEVLQKTRVQVDEDGTRAASATAVSVKCMAMLDPEPPVEMTVDRPFAFLIVDAQTNAICFAGVIENPAQA